MFSVEYCKNPEKQTYDINRIASKLLENAMDVASDHRADSPFASKAALNGLFYQGAKWMIFQSLFRRLKNALFKKKKKRKKARAMMTATMYV